MKPRVDIVMYLRLILVMAVEKKSTGYWLFLLNDVDKMIFFNPFDKVSDMELVEPSSTLKYALYF